MKYISTRGDQTERHFCEILLEGLAPDGGLYLPESYPQVDGATLDAWRKILREQGIRHVAGLVSGDSPEADVEAILAAEFGPKDTPSLPPVEVQTAQIISLEAALVRQEAKLADVIQPSLWPADPMDAAEALALVGLAERRHHFVSQLSGGEQQRVAIARAIAKRPAVLLCDEPTGALDSATGVLVLQALEHIHRETGALTVIITHNVGIAAMANRVIYLSDGAIAREERHAQPRPAAELHW